MKIFCYMLQSLFLDLSPLIPWLPEWRVSTLPPRCPCRWPAAPPHGTWPRPSRRTRLPLVPTGGRTSACTRCPTCTVLYCTVLYCTVLYEVSYMWYSGLACCTTVVLGSALSLVPSLRQKQHPHPDLSVPVMEVENTTSIKLCVLFMKILH